MVIQLLTLLPRNRGQNYTRKASVNLSEEACKPFILILAKLLELQSLQIKRQHGL